MGGLLTTLRSMMVAFAVPAARVCELVAAAVQNPATVPACATRVTRTIVTRALDGAILLVALATKQRPKHSRYLKGVWAPQPAETTVYSAEVTGTVPRDLRGMFLTVCPNPEFLPKGGYHLFDGDGALIAVRFRADGASFAFHHLLTQKRAVERRIGHSRTLSIDALSGPSGLLLFLLALLRNFTTREPYSLSPANTNIEQHAGKVLALWEGAIPYQLRISTDGATMECAGRIDIEDRYNGAFSAHPVNHPTSGKLYAVSYTPTENHDAVVVVLDEKMKFDRAVPLNLGRKPMIHDAAITDRYVVIFDFPLLFDHRAFFRRNGKPFSFRRDKRSRLGLMPVDAIDDSGIIWFDTDPCFSFHTVCAWDTPSGIILYLCQMDNFDLGDPLAFTEIKLFRYEFDVQKRTCKVEQEPVDLSQHVIGDYSFELPFVNKTAVGGPVQYAYMATYLKNGGNVNRGVVKYNLRSSKVEGFIQYRLDGRPAEAVGEAAFVPREKPKSEDDGYIIVYIRDAENNICLQIYDARKMQEECMAMIYSPPAFHIPNGFHSEFVGEDALAALAAERLSV